MGGGWVRYLISPLVVGDECKHTFYIDLEISPHTPTAITHPLILTKTAILMPIAFEINILYKHV